MTWCWLKFGSASEGPVVAGRASTTRSRKADLQWENSAGQSQLVAVTVGGRVWPKPGGRDLRLSSMLAVMRDPARIDNVLAALRAVWLESPDLRLGQLVVSVIRPTDPCPEVFHAEDDAILKGLINYREVLQGAKSAKASGDS